MSIWRNTGTSYTNVFTTNLSEIRSDGVSLLQTVQKPFYPTVHFLTGLLNDFTNTHTQNTQQYTLSSL